MTHKQLAGRVLAHIRELTHTTTTLLRVCIQIVFFLSFSQSIYEMIGGRLAAPTPHYKMEDSLSLDCSRSRLMMMTTSTNRVGRRCNSEPSTRTVLERKKEREIRDNR